MSSLTIVITTCYPTRQLLETFGSIIASAKGIKHKLYLVSDRKPINPSLKKALQKRNVNIIENKIPSSAYSKQKQIIDITKSKYILLTQDDVLFDKNTIQNVLRQFKQNPKVTFVGSQNIPLKPQNLIESALNVGTRLNNQIARHWNRGDNYLAMLGRVMTFKTSWLKKMQIPKQVVSLDAAMYFENKRLGGVYACAWDSYLYFRNPQNLAEHMRKSSRFQHSKQEMSDLNFSHQLNLKSEYRLPKSVILSSAIIVFFQSPISFILYCIIYSYTRLKKIPADDCLTALWEVDKSTKVLI